MKAVESLMRSYLLATKHHGIFTNTVQTIELLGNTTLAKSLAKDYLDFI